MKFSLILKFVVGQPWHLGAQCRTAPIVAYTLLFGDHNLSCISPFPLAQGFSTFVQAFWSIQLALSQGISSLAMAFFFEQTQCMMIMEGEE